MVRATRDVTSLAAVPLARGPGARMTVGQVGSVARARAWWLTTDPCVGVDGVAARSPASERKKRRHRGLVLEQSLGHLVSVLANGAACEGRDAGAHPRRTASAETKTAACDRYAAFYLILRTHPDWPRPHGHPSGPTLAGRERDGHSVALDNDDAAV